MSARSPELQPDERPTVPARGARSGPLPLALSLLIHAVLVAALVLSRAGRGDLLDIVHEEGIPVEVVVDSGLDARLKPLVQLSSPADAPEALKPAALAESATPAATPAEAVKPVSAALPETAVAPEPIAAVAPPPGAIAAAQAAQAAALAPGRDIAAAAPPLPEAARAETVSLAPPELPLARAADLALPGAAPPVEAPVAAQPRIAATPPPAPPALAPAAAAAEPVALAAKPVALAAEPVALAAASPPPLAELSRQAEPPPLSVPSLAPREAAAARTDEARPVQTAALLPVSPPPQAVDPEAEVRAAIGGFDCARIGAKLDRESGLLALSGHVRSEGERRRLVEQAGRAAGVERVEASALRVVGDPYCRVLTFLDRAELARSEDQRQDLAALGTTAEAGIARYAAGSTLELTLNAPDFDSFIYVDYFSSDGRVFHLLPAERPDNRFAAEERVVIGGEKSRGRRAVIGPPYGLDIVVAIASSEPLFLRPRPATEAAADYLAALDGSIRALRARGFALKLEYAYFLTYTTERAPSQ